MKTESPKPAANPAQPPATLQRSATQIDTDEQHALLALQQVAGLGINGLNALLQQSDSVLQLLEQGPEPAVLQSLRPKTRSALVAFLRNPQAGVQWQIAGKTLDWLDRQGAILLLKADPRFPPLLRELPDCPRCLFLQGDAELFSRPFISIVGTRKPSRLGRQVAAAMGRDLVRAGFVVCSGMAFGIDTEAHSGALAGDGYTAAVWATGLDTVYPPSNLELSRAIAQRGAIVTEMPLGTPSTPGLFPRRNRIVSALSLGVVVVEAGLPSGSLITANLAAEQNREVFAVPGPVNQAQSKGCHQLIREGAHLVESAGDVLAILGGFRSLALPPVAGESEPPGEELARELPAGLRGVLDSIEVGPASFELLSRRCGLPADELNRALIDLELSGLVVVNAGQYSLALLARGGSR